MRFRAIEQMRTRGLDASERGYAEWSVRLMQAKRDLASTRAARIEALEEHAARMKGSRDRADMLYRASRGSGLNYLEAMYRYNEATTWVEKAKEEPIPEPLRSKPLD